MCFVTHCLRPFSVVNKEVLRAHMMCDHISLNTFKNYLAALTTLFEQNISFALSDRSALVFDGQATPEVHDDAVVATSLSVISARYCAACLRMCQFRG